MKRAPIISAVVGFAVTGLAAFLYFSYRIEPLNKPKPVHVAEVVKADAEACAVGEPNPRLLIVSLAPGLGPAQTSVNINHYNLTWSELQPRLSQILKTRAERTVFLVERPDLPAQSWSTLEKMIQGVAEVDHICIIDATHPPTWYPPKPPDGAGGGTKLASS